MKGLLRRTSADSAFLWVVGIQFLIAAHAHSSPSTSIQQAVAKFRSDEAGIMRNFPPQTEIAPRFVDSYEKWLHGKISSQLLHTYSIASLTSLFDAANTAAFYSFYPVAVRDMRSIADELRGRNELSDRQAKQVFEALFSARLVPEARRWRQKYAIFFPQPMPEFVDPPGRKKNLPTEWVVEEARNVVERRAVDISSGSSVIVAAHPLCHFSQNAIAQIMADPILRKRLEGHVKWLVPQHRNYDLQLVRDWNRDHPAAPMSFAYKFSEWPQMDAWDTPTFYFFRDGHLVAKVAGWPDGGNMEKLYKASARAGLAETTHQGGTERRASKPDSIR